MTTRTTYRIIIKGKLADQWIGWFNGTIVEIDNRWEWESCTELTCKVRDQDELLRILNRLKRLDLPVLRVTNLNSVKFTPVKGYGLIY
jgi:hypothetical protein